MKRLRSDFEAKNAERGALIHKKFSSGLTPGEEKRLETLRAFVDAEMTQPATVHVARVEFHHAFGYEPENHLRGVWLCKPHHREADYAQWHAEQWRAHEAALDPLRSARAPSSLNPNDKDTRSP